jgi:ATP-dependent exoDNAse (exonuclease V) beta subunit
VTAETKRLPRIAVESADALESADPTRAIVPNSASHRADAGIAWGTLIHGLLEHAMRHRSATRDDLQRLAMWLTVEEPQLRAVIEQALDTVEAVAHAEFWGEARASAECHEEVPFALREMRGGAPFIITGAIDLVHRTSAGWRAIDYKTDVDLGDEDKQRRYAEQLRTYAVAWGRVAGVTVTTAVVPARRGEGASNADAAL